MLLSSSSSLSPALKVKYTILNPQYTLRHSGGCSYIIKRLQSFDPQIVQGSNALSIVPNVVGFLLYQIGLLPFQESIQSMCRMLGVNADVLKHFILNLTANDRRLKIRWENCDIYFPKRLLLTSETKRVLEKHGQIGISEVVEPSKFHKGRPLIPFSVNIMLTNRCYTNCVYCYANRTIGQELATEKVIEIIKEAESIGVVDLALTGGDLLMRSDSIEVFKQCISSGFSPIVSTKTPKDNSYVTRLSDIGIKELQFSLDSVNPCTLTRLIKVNHNYLAEVTSFFETCAKHNISLSIRSVITSLNSSVEEVSAVYSFLHKFENIEKWTITPAFHSEYRAESDEIAPRESDLKKIYEFTSKLEKKIPIYYNKIDDDGYSFKQFGSKSDFLSCGTTCLANSTSMSILLNGDCTICEMLYDNPIFNLGNILNSSISEVWNSRRALEIYYGKLVDQSRSTCNSCEFSFECKSRIFKHVCYVDVVKVNGLNCCDYPDPRCPESISRNILL